MTAAPTPAPRRAAPPTPSAPTGLRARLQQRKRTKAATRSSGSRRVVRVLSGTLVLLIALVVLSLVVLAPRTGGRHVSLDDIGRLADSSRVTSARFLDQDNRVTALVKADPGIGALLPAGGRIWTAYPSNGTLTAALEQSLAAGGAIVAVDQQSGIGTVRFIAQFLLPVLILTNLFALLLNAGKGGSSIGEVISFGSLTSGRTGATPVRFTDVGGAAEAVEELAEVRDYLLNPARYEAFGAAPPKGVLLFGPPGTGKTLLAKAVAGEAGVPFFSVAGAQFVESLVGVGAARVRDLFARVRAVAPAILFIDELDALGRRRGAGGSGGGSDEREQTLNQLLVEMDGFEVTAGIVVIAATNRPDILDPALMRPGRFDRHITVERPDTAGRRGILAIHSAAKPLAADVDLDRLAESTTGFTGADLANVVNEAALLALRGSRTTVTAADLDEAVQRVLSGPQRRGRVLTDAEITLLALHEAGRALVAAALDAPVQPRRVSVLPRGRTVAGSSREESELGARSTTALSAQLATLMAGVAAERWGSGDDSTAAEGDLAAATALARDMAGRYGMSPTLGRPRLLTGGGTGFLGGSLPLGEIAPGTQEELDGEVRRLMAEAELAAWNVLEAHPTGLGALVATLVEQETLEGEELHAAVAAALAADAVPEPPARKARTRRQTAG